MIPQEILLFGMGALLTVAASIFTFWVIRSGARNRQDSPGSGGGNPNLNTRAGAPIDPGLPVFSKDPHVSPEQIIRRGLEDLLRRDAESAFTIFEQRGGGAFVQFVLTPEGLVLDFPLADLNQEQINRAMAFFAEQGIASEEYRDARGTAQMAIYRQSFGKNVAGATDVAMRIFERVYEVSGDFSIYLKTE